MRLEHIMLSILVLISTTGKGQKKYQQTFPVDYNSKGIYKNVQIGDIVPDFKIPKIVNSSKRSAKISDFKDQLLIVDFWSINCSGCVSGLPKMDSLQKQFGDKIKILPVTWEEEATVLDFWKTNNKTKKILHLPSVVEDINFSSHFQHQIIPHEVWIYKGRVIAITNDEYVDAHNIQSVLEEKEVKWPVKYDYHIYDYNKPLFQLRYDVQKRSSLKYSGILGYQEKATTTKGEIIDSLNNSKRYYFINYSILAIYKSLWQEIKKTNLIPSATRIGESFTPTQLKLEVKDPSRYLYGISKEYYEDWKRNNMISYEFVSPDIGLDTKVHSQKMVTDLNRLLGLNGRWEKRLTKCLILVKTSDKDKIRSLGGPTKIIYDGELKGLRNLSLRNLIYWMNSFAKNPPLFDETGYKQHVDIDLKINSWTDIPALRKALQAYDLDLKEEVRELDMFVLTEVSN